MMFLFAYLGSLSGSPGWPVHLMHLTEAAFVIVVFVCVLLARRLKGTGAQGKRDWVAVIGGVSASFGLIMPFELAPFFFNARGEIMLGTIALNLFYPIAAALFIFLFGKFMNVARKVPPSLPAAI
jgi:thiosulfate dehydrogenase (quinone) large subunit